MLITMAYYVKTLRRAQEHDGDTIFVPGRVMSILAIEDPSQHVRMSALKKALEEVENERVVAFVLGS